LANGDSTGSFVQQLGTTISAALPALANFLVAAQPIGQVFLTLLVPGINAFSGALSAVTGPLKGVASFLENNKTAATVLGTAIVGTVVAVKAITTAMTIYRTALAAAAAIQGAFNAVLALNPVFLVVLAIAALIAILVLAYNKVDWFKTAVDAAWNGIKVASIALWDALVAVFNGIVGAISGYVNLIKGYINLWVAAFMWIVDAAKNIYTGVVGKVGELVGYIASIPGKITSALGNLGGLLKSAGKAVIDGFVNGIKGAFGSVKNALGDLTSKLTSWKGPLPLDKVILMGAGQAVIGGFVRGLESQYGTVKRSLAGLTSDVAGTQFALAGPDFNSSSLRGVNANRGGTTVVLQPGAIVIEATPGTDRAAIAREIRGILRDGERLGVA
jgi:phage-related protein